MQNGIEDEIGINLLTIRLKHCIILNGKWINNSGAKEFHLNEIDVRDNHFFNDLRDHACCFA